MTGCPSAIARYPRQKINKAIAALTNLNFGKFHWSHFQCYPKPVWQEVFEDIWQEVFEDDHGLYVKGQILKDVQCGKEALALIKAGAIDGLSIGYRTLSATKDKQGNRCLNELELWEVSLVTFPMLLPEARLAGSL